MMAIPQGAPSVTGHVSDKVLQPFLQPGFDAAQYLNATLPSLSIGSLPSRQPASGNVATLADLSSQAQTLLSQLNAQASRLTTVLTQLTDDIWDLLRKMDRPLTTGRRDDRIATIKEWAWLTDESSDADQVRLCDAFTDWCWRPRYCGGEFDFADEAYFRQGVDLVIEGARKRYNRGRPVTPCFSCFMQRGRQGL